MTDDWWPHDEWRRWGGSAGGGGEREKEDDEDRCNDAPWAPRRRRGEDPNYRGHNHYGDGGASAGSSAETEPQDGAGECGDASAMEDEVYRPGQQVLFHDLVLMPRGGRSAPAFTLLFFHSCSHGPEDVLHYVPYLWRIGLRPGDVRIVAPCSPQRRYDDGWVCNAWHDYVTDCCWRGKPDRVAWPQFVEQRGRLLEILEEEHNRLPPGGRLVLGGLSQGAALALDVMLHAPPHINSLVGCFCTRGMMQEETLWDLPVENVRYRASSCPVQIFHGKKDSIVPWRVARKSYQWLRTNGFDVDFKTAWVSHSSECLLEYMSIAKFVSQRWNHRLDA